MSSRLRGILASCLALPRLREIPDPPAGRPVMYLDAASEQLVLALGSRRLRLLPEPVGGPRLRALKTDTINVDNPGIPNAWLTDTINVADARVGDLVVVGLAQNAPGTVRSAPAAWVSAKGVVTVGITMATTAGSVSLSVAVTVYRV